MRRRNSKAAPQYKILVLDDEVGIIDSLSVVLRRNGYGFEGVTEPLEAIEKVRNNHYDLLILDYMMSPINGDAVVERIRQFNTELYILLLTGHKDMAPPLETIKKLEIQGYCEKSDKFDQLILLVESAIKSIKQMNTIKKFKDGLNKILDAVPKIYQLQPIGSILEGILIELMYFVNSENAFILVDNTEDINNMHNSIFRGIGRYNTSIREFMAMLDPALMERIGYTRTQGQTVKTEAGVIFPLINEMSQPIGIIYVESQNLEEDIKLLELYAKQSASALNNAFLHSLVNTKNEELNRTYNQLKKNYLDTIEALRLTVDAKDEYTCGHSDRVSYFARKTGEAMGLSQEDIELLATAGIFHDIGKIGTADDILRKNNKLDKQEYDIIKQHPLKGAHILSAMSMFKDVVPLVKYHHEWYNGKGYCEGLKGEEIPLLARVISVADAFDAMTTNRHYRSKLDITHAREQLVTGAGTQFDPDVVKVFVEAIVDNFEAVSKEIEHTYLVQD
ncbi:MAG: HD domain-containing phosphohydrolase [Oscillospiraceae bacterium]